MANNEHSKKLGNLLREWRIARKLDQQQLARALGYSQSYVCDVEGGKKPASAELLDAIATYFGVNRLGLAHLAFLSEYFDSLLLPHKNRVQADMFWTYVEAGIKKLADPDHGIDQLRALSSFVTGQQILDREGALTWQRSLSNLRCLWVATLDFRDGKEKEFYEVARDNIKRGAMYVYFIREEYLATEAERRAGIEKDFDKFLARLNSDIGIDAVSRRVFHVTFREGEQIAAVNFVVANPRTQNAEGFHTFDRIDNNCIYNIKLSDEALRLRVDELIRYLGRRPHDRISEDKLFPAQDDFGLDTPLESSGRTPNRIEREHIPIILVIWRRLRDADKPEFNPLQQKSTLNCEQMVRELRAIGNPYARGEVVTFLEEIIRYQNQYGWEILSVTKVRDGSIENRDYELSFPDNSAVGYPATASFLLYLDGRLTKDAALKDAALQYNKTFESSVKWALHTGYIEPSDVGMSMLATTSRVKAEQLYLEMLAEYHDPKSENEWALSLDGAAHLNEKNINELIISKVDNWLHKERNGQEWLRVHGLPSWMPI